PADLKALVDHLHRRGIGVVLDWVPSGFPSDEHGLAEFDGTHLYEHADGRRPARPEWGSATFDLGRPEVRSFLLSNAVWWLDEFHADGLRVDAVASVLHPDDAQGEGGWVRDHAGRGRLEAVSFLRECNAEIARR